MRRHAAGSRGSDKVVSDAGKHDGPRRRCRWTWRNSWASGLIGCLLLLLLPDTVLGQTWSSLRLPVRRQATAGFSCQLTWLEAPADGYLPLRFTATPDAGSFPGDRSLVLQITPSAGENWPAPDYAYRVNIQLKAQAKSFDQTFYLPKYFTGTSFEIALFDIDGPLPGYQIQVGSQTTLRQRSLNLRDLHPVYAVLTPEPNRVNADDRADWEHVPDFRTLTSLYIPQEGYLTAKPTPRLSDDAAQDYLMDDATIVGQRLTPTTAHENWLGYESVDIVIAPFPMLVELREQSPARFEALRQWLSTGGVLWTYASPPAAELAQFLEVALPADYEARLNANLTRARPNTTSLIASPNKTWLNIGRMRGQRSNNTMFFDQDANSLIRSLLQMRHPVMNQIPDDEMVKLVAPVPVEAGMVVGLTTADPFPGNLAFWNAVRHCSGSRQVWQYRRATSLSHGSPGFWDWQLANVARPPVYAFLFVLTIFVLLVGPVSYYFTRRVARTYLMFVIAPLLAAASTFALFAYGFFADGFDVQSRVRQITWVDGVSGRGATLTRGTYFAPFRQTEGLRFPADTAVYPLIDTYAAYQQQLRANVPRRDRLITVDDESIRFTGEYFPARSQSQFVGFHPLAGNEGVTFEFPAGEDPQFRNGFPFTLTTVIAHDRDGNYWQLDDGPLPPGEVRVPKSIPTAEQAPRLRELYRRFQPEPPYGYRPPANDFQFNTRNADRTNAQWFRQTSWAQSNDGQGVFEAHLQNVLSNQAALPKGSFVGLAELEPDQIAAPQARQVESVHFVIGNLP